MAKIQRVTKNAFSKIQKQRTLLIEQTNKLSEMLDVLNKKHSTLEINDEGKFLAILK